MYIPLSVYRQVQWEFEADLLSLRLSHFNRIANMRKQLFQLVDDRLRIEIAAHHLFHTPPGIACARPLPIKGERKAGRNTLRILRSLRLLPASA